MADFNTNDTMVDMFLFETTQLLDQLEQILLTNDSDNSYSEETINEIFRIMHTVKGSSAMMMYDGISDLSHTIEDIFFYLREEKPDIYSCTSLNDLILDAIDFMKVELEKIRNKDKADGKASDLINKLRAFLTDLKNNTGIQTDTSKTRINIFKAVIYYENGCEMENIRAFSLIHNLKNITEELIYYPSDIMDNDSSAEIIRRDGFQIYLKTDKSYDEINNFLMQTIFLKEMELTKIDNEMFAEVTKDFSVKDLSSSAQEIKNSNIEAESTVTNVNKEEKSSETHTVLATQNIISVSVAKLDKLMDLVGEMVIAEAMVLQNPDLEGLELDNFQKAARQLSKITSEIQDMVMSVRMVPLSATFQRMNRIVRDMCKKLSKEVNLEIIGEETEVDKNIIERITDPLMHVVRNAVDHGIETADEREALGKDKKGTITLEAKNISSDVHIIVKDDGRGLDREKILKKARENHLLKMNEEDMSDSDIYKLILLPGFSTKENITEFSGRGVGMDVVTKNIESIGGSILIDSEKNKGTQITLKIPLTLAIIDGMNLQVGNSTYTIPTISIQESFKPKEKDVIIDPDGNEMILVRGQCYPILRLHRLFKVETDVKELSDGIITMVSQDDKVICIFADRLLGQQQVVVKSLPEYIKRFKKIKGISGCTLLGDGRISLILDIAGLIYSNK